MAAPAGVAPSILAADFARLAEQVATVLDAGARTIHVDVMDGHFVPPLSMGPAVVEALAGQVHDVGGFIDVHLMIERPEQQVANFANAGADGITVHVEATPHAQLRAQRGPRRRLPGRAGAQPGHPGGRDRRARRAPRPGPLHDREPRLGRPEVPARLAREDRAAAGHARRRAGAGGGRRDRRRGPPGRARARARPCSSQDPRCSARTIRGRHASRSHAQSRHRGVWPPVWARVSACVHNRSRSHGANDPDRRRPPVVPGECARRPRVGRLQRRRRGRRRGLGARGVLPAPARRSSCSTSSCRTSTASTSVSG